MKHVIGILLLFTISCSNPISKEESIISDYVQRIGNTKTDLSFKTKEMTFIRDISAQDSVKWFVDNYSEKNDQLDSLLNKLKANRVKYNSQLSTLYEQQRKAIALMSSGSYHATKEAIKVSNLIKDAIEKLAPIRERDSIVLSNIEKYQSVGDSILAKQYQVTYTIKNPLLNNAEQELNRTFYLSSDLTRVIKADTQ